MDFGVLLPPLCKRGDPPGGPSYPPTPESEGVWGAEATGLALPMAQGELLDLPEPLFPWLFKREGVEGRIKCDNTHAFSNKETSYRFTDALSPFSGSAVKVLCSGAAARQT